MSNLSHNIQPRALTSSALHDAYTDFELSRRAMLCTDSTLAFYHYLLSRFLDWLETQNISRPDDIDAGHVRAFLAKLKAEEKTSWTINDYGRAIRTLLYEGYNVPYYSVGWLIHIIVFTRCFTYLQHSVLFDVLLVIF